MHLAKFLRALSKLAATYGVACVITNQVPFPQRPPRACVCRASLRIPCEFAFVRTGCRPGGWWRINVWRQQKANRREHHRARVDHAAVRFACFRSLNIFASALEHPAARSPPCLVTSERGAARIACARSMTRLVLLKEKRLSPFKVLGLATRSIEHL